MVSGEYEIERELKFSNVEHSLIREKLRELQAEKMGVPVLEDNYIFDHKDQLKNIGCVLRLRIENNGGIISFKGPPTFKEGVKIRQEIETRVENPYKMRKILELLGYKVMRRYQKIREVWRLGGVTIYLDRTPIGNFVEFEGMGSEKVALRCGLDPENAEKKSYVELYDEYREQHPNAPLDMIFENEK